MNNETNYCREKKSCQKSDCKGCLLRGIEEPKLGEECGVFGMYDLDGNDVASSIYYGLFALQHRGQESCGIAVSRTDGPPRNSNICKGMGLVNEVFNAENLEKMAGDIGVGHVRYSTAGASVAENTQPLVLNYIKGTLSMAHNGNLVNAVELRRELEMNGAIFQTSIDSEVIAYLIARERLKVGKVEEAVKNAMLKLKGAYSLVVASPRKLIGARDPFGFRPLCIGKRDNAYVLSSEVSEVLAMLGFDEIEQFAFLIKQLLGDYEITNEDVKKMTDEIMATPRKLNAVPFKVAREDVEDMAAYLA